jgi:hypothetical protein
VRYTPSPPRRIKDELPAVGDDITATNLVRQMPKIKVKVAFLGIVRELLEMLLTLY